MKNSVSEKTRRSIINAALKLFVRKGYHGTSISDISQQAKLTKGAIYFHFKNKNALLKRILEEYDEMFLQRLINEVEKVNGKGIDKCHSYIKFSSNFVSKHRDMCLFLTTLATELCGSTSKEEEKWIKEIFKKYYEFVTMLLEEGKQDGSLRGDINPNVLAINLIGANEGNLIQWNVNRKEIDNEIYARSFLKFFLTGIRSQELTR
jgi:AcrR family transcriptional regulator